MRLLYWAAYVNNRDNGQKRIPVSTWLNDACLEFHCKMNLQDQIRYGKCLGLQENIYSADTVSYNNL